ncbi:MAG: CoA-binding protein [Gemmatimonadaceae bacterium]
MTERPDSQRSARATDGATEGMADGATQAADDSWRDHLLESSGDIRALLERTRRIAVLGIKPASTGAPAAYVPDYAQRAGYEIVPVPVYFPEVTEMFGEPVYRRLADIPEPVDMVNVFRRSGDIPPHLDDILATRPSSVWFQLGIRNDAVAEQLARAGIDVVQDRCLLVELQSMGL